MSLVALPYFAASTPTGSLVAESDHSGPSFTVMVVVVVAVLVLLTLFGGARHTVVVVENPGRSLGNFLGVLSIVIAVGIIWFAYLAPGRGSA